MFVLSKMLEPISPVLKAWRKEIQLGVSVLVLAIAQPALAEDFKLELPIECEIGVECFFQNFADLDPSEAVRDPWCEGAAYDGHKGTDIRLLSLKDIARDVPAIASASGTVRGVRDGEVDRIVRTQADREAVSGKECGNGVVIDHDDGYQTQYCHLKEGSLQVTSGQQVKTGELLGFVGNSGFAQFPHVHLTLRKDGKWIDIVSGLQSSDACEPFDLTSGYFSQAAIEKLPRSRRQLLDIGMTGNAFHHQDLVETGAPILASIDDPVTIGWAWLINLSKGDVITLNLNGPEGFSVTNTLEPLDRNKATYSVFTGRKRPPLSGDYALTVSVADKEGAIVLQKEKTVTVENPNQ